MNTPTFISSIVTEDIRGDFAKHLLTYLPTEFKLKDYFVTSSKRNVLRGMHWQSPPHETNRIITLLEGKIFDVTIDMRKNSPQFGNIQTWNLESDNRGYLFVPKGFAHGYQVVSETALISYLTDGEYCPEHDRGVLWSSLDIEWPNNDPIVSERDNSFSTLKSFVDKNK